ncbi:MAG: diaminopimelate epimerase [Candidatus Cloacimonas sp.]
MLIPFLKMQAQGNDFVIVDYFVPETNALAETDFPSLAEDVCKPHFGVGADGLVLLKPYPICDAQMIIYNANGSRAEMCGSALRCVTWLLHKKTAKKEFRILTDSGEKKCRINADKTITVNLGVPEMLKNNYIAEGFTGDLIKIGNPHFIIWKDDLTDEPQFKYGALIEHHSGFEETVNVHFASLLNKNKIAIKIWEKGCGATLACGTGASASVFSGIWKGILDNEVYVTMPGGTVEITASESGYLLSGEVNETFQGKYIWKI